MSACMRGSSMCADDAATVAHVAAVQAARGHGSAGAHANEQMPRRSSTRPREIAHMHTVLGIRQGLFARDKAHRLVLHAYSVGRAIHVSAGTSTANADPMTGESSPPWLTSHFGSNSSLAWCATLKAPKAGVLSQGRAIMRISSSNPVLKDVEPTWYSGMSDQASNLRVGAGRTCTWAEGRASGICVHGVAAFHVAGVTRAAHLHCKLLSGVCHTFLV